MLYEGKAKRIHVIDENTVLLEFKNSLTAGDGAKKGTMEGKGEINATISARLFKLLEEHGVPTHFIEQKSENELVCKNVSIVPIEVVVRNIATGSFARRYGVSNKKFDRPLVEFFLKDDDLHDPLITEDSIILLELATRSELELLKHYALTINAILGEFFQKNAIELVDFKLEFGKTASNELILADEITPDTMRLWKIGVDGPEKIIDKDRFRQDLGNILQAYEEVLSVSEQPRQLDAPIQQRMRMDILLKSHIKDPRGETILRGLKQYGLEFVEKVRYGKNLVLTFNAPLSPSKLAVLEKAAVEFLTNPLVETYSLRVED